MNIQFISSSILVFFMLSLIPIAIADWRTRYIPDRYHLIAGTLALLYHIYPYINPVSPTLHMGQTVWLMLLIRLVSTLFCACPFILLYFIRDDIGGADAKFAAIVGFFCSLEVGLSILLLGTGLTFSMILLQHLVKRENKGHTYPLLPALVLFLFLHALSLFVESF